MEENNEREVENIYTAALSRISKDIDLLYKDYVTNKPAPELSEFIFQEHFLEFFKKFKNSEYDELTPEEGIKLNKWLELVGGPYREMSIVDNKGQELYRVPPIYTTNTIESVQEVDNDVSLNQIGKSFADRYKTNPTRAVPALHATISGLPKFIKPVETQISDIQRWDKIFKRYEENITDDIIPNTDNAVPQIVKERLGLVIQDDDDDDDTPL